MILLIVVHHHKRYNLTKVHNSQMCFVRVKSLFYLKKIQNSGHNFFINESTATKLHIDLAVHTSIFF